MIRYLVSALVLMWLTCLPAGSRAGELLCTDGGILIQGVDPRDLREACEAVVSAAPFFKTAGLAMPRSVTIRLLEGRSSSLDAIPAVGSFDAADNAIQLLAYRAAAATAGNQKADLGKIRSYAHWRSYVVHELTHAAIHQGCDNSCPSRAIHEYVASVAQFASLPSPLRREILGHYAELEPFNRMSEISETYYAINPHYFAVKAYKHFQQLAEPENFFRTLLHPGD